MYLLLSLTPVLCALAFSAFTWRSLKSPVLFITVAVLLALGVHQAVLIGNAMSTPFNNQFLVASGKSDLESFTCAFLDIAILFLVLKPLSRRL